MFHIDWKHWIFPVCLAQRRLCLKSVDVSALYPPKSLSELMFQSKHIMPGRDLSARMTSAVYTGGSDSHRPLRDLVRSPSHVATASSCSLESVQLPCCPCQRSVLAAGGECSIWQLSRFPLWLEGPSAQTAGARWVCRPPHGCFRKRKTRVKILSEPLRCFI